MITRYCKHKGSFAELFRLPVLRYLPALLLPAALALHVWATETLGKVGSQLTTAQHQQRQDMVHRCIVIYIMIVLYIVHSFSVCLQQARNCLAVPSSFLLSAGL